MKTGLEAERGPNGLTANRGYFNLLPNISPADIGDGNSQTKIL